MELCVHHFTWFSLVQDKKKIEDQYKKWSLKEKNWQEHWGLDMFLLHQQRMCGKLGLQKGPPEFQFLIYSTVYVYHNTGITKSCNLVYPK